MILNQKFRGQNETTHISAADGEGGRGAMVIPMDLKSDCIKETACPIAIFCE